MNPCRRRGRDRPPFAAVEGSLLAYLTAALFTVIAYQAGFEATAAAAAALDTYTP